MNVFNIVVFLKLKYPKYLDPDCQDPKSDPTKIIAERYKGIVQHASIAGGHFRDAERKAKNAVATIGEDASGSG